MNKIFKTIWDAETRQVVVVSELAKSKGKTKSSTGGALKAVVLAVATTAGIGAMQNADAAMVVGGAAGNAKVEIVNLVHYTGNPAKTMGVNGTIVTGSGKGMAVGENATVYFSHANAGIMNTANALAIGNNATANNTSKSVVIGSSALAQEINAVVIGNNATAIKAESASLEERPVTVIGMNALVRNVNTIGGKNAQSIGSTAIGGNALAGLLTSAGATTGTAVSLTDGDYATDSGGFTAGRLMYRSGIVNASGQTVGSLQSNEATAIGVDSRAIGDQSVAIGAQVVAGHASVAIGGNDIEKVANGTNNATYKSIVGTDSPINRFDPTTGLVNTTCVTANTWYETTYAKDGSVAIGAKAHSNALYGTALGTAAYVEAGGELGTAIGTGARVGSQTQVIDANLTVTSDFTTKGGVAIAAGAVAEHDYTTAIGTGSKAIAVNATAIGYQALANGTNATAVGAKAIAAAADALAYGANATSYAANAVAIGTNATTTTTAESSIAFGTDTTVSGVKTVALGSNIQNVTTNGSVVLGDSSTGVVGAVGASHAVGTVPDAQVTSANGAVVTYGNFSGQPADAGKYVSIGAVGAERQLKNVAAGNIAPNSTDGINGSQLYSVTAALGNEVFKSTYFHVNNVTNAGKGDSTTNLGNISDAAGAVGDYAVTAGVNATAANGNAIAIGHNAKTVSSLKNQNSSVSIGHNAISWSGGIAMGRDAKALGNPVTGLADGAIAIGNNAAVEGTSGTASASIAIGSYAFASAIKTGATPAADSDNGETVAWNGDAVALGVATSVGDHAYAHIGSSAFGQLAYAKGQNATALGQQALATGDYSTAVGFSTDAKGKQTVALGYNSTAGVENGGDILVRDLAIGTDSLATGGDSTAIGSGSAALADKSIAIGYVANAKTGAANSVAVGYQSKAINTNGTAVGHASVVGDVAATAIGVGARALGTDSFAAARLSRAHGDASNAIGFRAFALGTNSTAIGTNATAATGNSIAIGSNANAGDLRANLAVLNQAQADLAAQYLTENNSTKIAALKEVIAAEEEKLAAANAQNTIAIGTGTQVLGNESIAIGKGHVVLANNSGTFGDPNYIRAGADRSYAFGNNNTITTADTFVLGSNVNRNADGTDNVLGTVANSVYLGNGTEVTAGGAVGTAVLDTDQVAGATTTAGDTGTVENATIANITYGSFAGDTANGAVSVGAAGAERRIQNVAAGEISATSTDAINGSQLYFVAEQAAKPLTITANTNADTDAELLDKQYAAGDGTQQQLGETLAIIGAATGTTLARNTDKAVTGTYSAKNIQTVVSNGEVQIQMAENPEFKSLNITDGTNSTVISPTTITVGGDTANPVTIDGTNGTISNLTTTIQVPATSVDAANKPTTNLTNAATLGDVLNAGWNLKENGDARDVVTPYDTVNFINGTGTTVNITTTDNVSVVKVNVDTSALVGDITNNTNGTVSVGDNADGDKLANITTVVNAINSSGWNVTSAAADGGSLGKDATVETINPGETVTFKAGKNMVLTQETNNFTYATADNVTFNNVNTTTLSVGDTTTAGSPVVNFTAEAATPATNNPTAPTTALNITSADGNPTQITGVGSVLDTQNIATNPNGTAATSTLVNLGTEANPLPDSVLNSAATVRDIANMGWIVSAAGNDYTDTVKNANEVKFVGKGLATVTGKTDDLGVRTITVDVNAQSTVETAQTPVVYTDVDGNKLYKQADGTFNTSPDGTGDTVQPVDVIASMNTGGNNTTTPMTLANIKGSLAPTYNVGDLTQGTDGNLTDTPSTTYTNASTAPTADEVKAMYNNAATVGDILNAGWNLQENGGARDFVKPYDTVNFVNGKGTTANVTVNTNGTVANVTYNVNVDNSTIKVDDNGNLTVNTDNLPKTVLANGTNTVVEGSGTTDDPYKVNVSGDLTDITSISNGNTTISLGDKVVNVGGATITGVAPGDISANSTDAINGSQLYNAINGVGKTVVEAGKNTTVDTRTEGNVTTYVVNAEKTTITQVAGSPVTVTSTSDPTTGVTDYQLDVAVDGDTIQVVDGKLVSSGSKIRETVVAGSSNVVVTDTKTNATGGKEFTVDLAQDISVNSVTANVVNVGPVTMTGSTGSDGVNELSIGSENSPTRITNVAPGKNPTDAVNVSQLKGYVGGVVNALDKDLSAGVAGAMAGGNLYHATLPGKSMVSAGAATFRGQSAFAVGYSRLSDNGKYGIKAQVNTNTRGDTGAAVSVGYQW